MADNNYRDEATMRRLEREMEEKREKARNAEASLQEDIKKMLRDPDNRSEVAKDLLGLYRNNNGAPATGDLAHIRRSGGSEGGLFGIDDSDY